MSRSSRSLVLFASLSVVVACVGGGAEPSGAGEGSTGRGETGTEPEGRDDAGRRDAPSSARDAGSATDTTYCFRNLGAQPGCYCTPRDLAKDDPRYEELRVASCGPDEPGFVCCAEPGWPSSASCDCNPRACRQSADGKRCACARAGSTVLDPAALPRVVTSCSTSGATCCRDATTGACTCTATGASASCPSGASNVASCEDLDAYCAGLGGGAKTDRCR